MEDETMYGWRGKILRVDLTLGKIYEEFLDPKVAKDFIGGRGLGIYYLLKEIDSHCDPFGGENKLIMGVGPLTGIGAPTGNRYMVMTKSPLTGGITFSNSGGRFPTEMKKAGYDLLIFQGKSASPVYLWINRGKVELRSAKHLWGKTVYETEDTLKAETEPDARVACIGPAGERLVLFAAIMNEKDRAAARGGVGAVMGSKGLKAVVVRGEGEIPIANEERFVKINKTYRETFKEKTKNNPPPLRLHGTAVTVGILQSYGVLPTHNFQQGTFGGWENIAGETVTKKYLTGSKPCYNCSLGCARWTKVSEPPYEGEGGGPEYETIYAFGSDCGVDNLAAVIKAGYLCNELGLDTISMGATIACAMELSEKGWISEAVIGKPLKFGDAEAIVELTRQTAYREGFGDILAEGSFRIAERYGHVEIAMVSKRLEFPGYDVRGAQGQGLGFATSPIGASHMRCQAAYFELLGVPFNIDRLSWEDKPLIIKDWQDSFAILDAAGLCILYSVRNLLEPSLKATPIGVLELLNAATGVGYSLEELVRAGERIWNAERLFLVRAGFRRKEDSLPDRMTQDPLPDGPSKGMVCHLEEMLEKYYQLRGWTRDGIPTEVKLKELGLLDF
jgi:aldehyde:ferredoxin oxidoreductase